MAVIVAMSCGARCLRSLRIPSAAWRSVVGNALPPICSPVNVICRRVSTFSGRNWNGGQGHWWSKGTLTFANVRHMVAAATVFFWDRERITNQDVMRCLRGFQDRQTLTNSSSLSDTASSSDNSCEIKGDIESGNGEEEEGGGGGGGGGSLCVAQQSTDHECNGDSDSGEGGGDDCGGKCDSVSITAGSPMTVVSANGNGGHLEMSSDAAAAATSTHAAAAQGNNIVSISSQTDEENRHCESISKTDDCHSISQTGGDGVNMSESVVGSEQENNSQALEVTEDSVVGMEQGKGREDGSQDYGAGKSTGVERIDSGDSNQSGCGEDLKEDVTNQAVVLAGDTAKVKEEEDDESDDPLAGWEFVLQEKTCTVYKKQYGDTGLNQYKVIGGYSDISARDYLDVQVDNEGRKLWDTYVVKLETVDRDKHTGSEIVHWILKYPFPMANREYVFVRRAWINKEEDTIVLINRSVDKHPRVPQNSRCVRVKTYFSEMVIKADTHIDEPGLKYELTYFDNPGTYLPSAAVTWVTNAATPDFLKKIHDAALKRSRVSQEHSQSL